MTTKRIDYTDLSFPDPNTTIVAYNAHNRRVARCGSACHDSPKPAQACICGGHCTGMNRLEAILWASQHALATLETFRQEHPKLGITHATTPIADIYWHPNLMH